MFLVGHEDFVAGLHVDAVGDVAVGFGGVAEESDFVAAAADEFGERVAELVPGGVSPDGVVLGIVLRRVFRSRCRPRRWRGEPAQGWSRLCRC